MKSTTSTPAELETITQHIHDLKAQLEGVQATIKSEEDAARIARDGFDRWDIRNAALVPELSKRGAIPEAREQAYQEFQRTRLADLMDAKKDIETALSMARDEWRTLHNRHRGENAESLQVEAAQHAADLTDKIAARQQHQRDLRQKIASITTVTAQRAAAMTAHDAAVAAAIAEGTAAPEAPQLPELPTETVGQLEGAIRLLDREIDQLRQDQQRSAAEAKALGNLLSARKVSEFCDMVVAEAKAQGLRLGDVRDKLVEIAGPTVTAQVDRSNAFAYRAEVDRMRPELERLRADNKVLQDGVAKLAARRYG